MVGVRPARRASGPQAGDQAPPQAQWTKARGGLYSSLGDPSAQRPALAGKPFTQARACEMVKRRCDDVGLGTEFCNHTFRGHGDHVASQARRPARRAAVAGHADITATTMYDRSGEDLQRAEVEREQL